MNQNKNVVIIGAGVAGIATSVFLARKGFSVDVYEQAGTPGGRCSRLIREGHRFDLGATIFLMPEIYKKVFDALGISFDETISSKKLAEIYRLYFTDGTLFHFTTDKTVMKAQLESLEPGSYDRFLNMWKKTVFTA